MSGHTNRTFAERLKEAQGDLVSEDLAMRLNVRPRTVHRWRAGTSEPSGEYLARLCRELDKDADYFFPPEEVAAA